MIHWRYFFGLLLCLCLLAGCTGKKVEKMVAVSGTVKLDGKPLDDGTITFVGDPGTQPHNLTITNGAFNGEVRVGKVKVEIRAYETKKAPATATGGATETKDNYLPEKFNTKTTLTAEVSEAGALTPNTFEVSKK